MAGAGTPWSASSALDPDNSNIGLNLSGTPIVHGNTGQSVSHQLFLDLVPPFNNPGNSLTYTFIDSSTRTYSPTVATPVLANTVIANYNIPQTGSGAWGTKQSNETWTIEWEITVTFTTPSNAAWSSSADYLILAAMVGPVGGISLYSPTQWSMSGTQSAGSNPSYTVSFTYTQNVVSSNRFTLRFTRAAGTALTLRGERIRNGASEFLRFYNQSALSVTAGAAVRADYEIVFTDA